jgi:pSer/pThr/pTyr-binding forkhead associated (FHA) protein
MSPGKEDSGGLIRGGTFSIETGATNDSKDLESTDVLNVGKLLPVKALPVGIRGCLKVINGPDKGRIIFLENSYNTIGRNETNTVMLHGTDVSGRHAVIYFSEGREWRIEDVGSTNGTLLNGSRVKEYALRSGDKILIGSNLIQFTIEGP